MSTGSSYLQSPFDILLAFYIRKIDLKIILRVEEFLSYIN